GGCQPAQAPNPPPTVATNHSSNLPSKQLKLSCLDEARSVDLANARPAHYHCTSQEADDLYAQLN
ncbi:hypothetical protein SK128_010539, partial [Halocaridina rubra]